MLISNVLNIPLAEQRGLSQKDVIALELLHVEKDAIFQSAVMRRMQSTHCTGMGRKAMVLALEEIEFSMQALWKFMEDRTYHTWWAELPGCDCRNTVINGERTRYIREDCEYHGTREI